MVSFDEIKQQAKTLGFELLGAAPVEAIGGGWMAPHVERYETWVKDEQFASMKWMANRIEERVMPEKLLPDVRSALVFWMHHKTPPPPRPAGDVGRVAAYAWGRDYHNVLRKQLRKLDRWFFQINPDYKRYVSIDTGAVLERAFGERAGVGWIGRSTMLINPSYGTFGSLGVIFVNFEVATAPEAHPFRCGTCRDCIDLCPTGALTDGRLDANKCISYWTIEHRGLIPKNVRAGLGEWVFGCDICQDVCPWNSRAPHADPGVWKPHADRAWPKLGEWINTPSDALEDTLIGSPLRRAKGTGLRRNAMIAAANLRFTTLLPMIEEVLETDDDPVLRATAAWAALTLGSETAAARARSDQDEMVRNEVYDFPGIDS